MSCRVLGGGYLSNEKNNYTTLQDTLLFSIDGNGQVRAEGTSWKRDREYTVDASAATAVPTRADCKEWIMSELDEAGGALPTKELESKAKMAGYSYATIRRAKDELKRDAAIKFTQTGAGKEKAWHIQKVETQQAFSELPADTPTPWPV